MAQRHISAAAVADLVMTLSSDSGWFFSCSSRNSSSANNLNRRINTLNINDLYVADAPGWTQAGQEICFFLNSFHTRLFQTKSSGTLPEPPLDITTLTSYGIYTCSDYSLELIIITLYFHLLGEGSVDIFTSAFSTTGASWNNILGYYMNSCYSSWRKAVLGSGTAHGKKSASVFFFDNLPIRLMPAVLSSVITSEG